MNLHRIQVKPELWLIYFYPLMVTKAQKISPTYINWLLKMSSIYLSLQTHILHAPNDNIWGIFVRNVWSKKPANSHMAGWNTGFSWNMLTTHEAGIITNLCTSTLVIMMVYKVNAGEYFASAPEAKTMERWKDNTKIGGQKMLKLHKHRNMLFLQGTYYLCFDPSAVITEPGEKKDLRDLGNSLH